MCFLERVVFAVSINAELERKKRRIKMGDGRWEEKRGKMRGEEGEKMYIVL